MSKLVVSAIFAAALIGAPAVHAVDIENQDGIDHQVTIAVGDGGPVTFTLKAGEKKMNLCSDEHCVLMLNDSQWEGLSDGSIVVKGGKLNVKESTPRG